MPATMLVLKRILPKGLEQSFAGKSAARADPQIKQNARRSKARKQMSDLTMICYSREVLSPAHSERHPTSPTKTSKKTMTCER